jgi:hypothetical protein
MKKQCLAEACLAVWNDFPLHLLFLHGNFLASELILFELACLRFVLCDEPKSQSTLELQSLLERLPSFQNYFGIIQDARETFLYLLDALKQEGGDGVLLAELMCVTTVQEIVYDCGHRHLIETTECIIDIHEDYFGRATIPLGECLGHREERVEDHRCELCRTLCCQIPYRITSLPPIVVLGVVREAEVVAHKLLIPLTFVWLAGEEMRRYALVACVCYFEPGYHFSTIVAENTDWIM